MNPRDFLPPWTPKLQVEIVCAAHDDLGEHEEPPGSNRGPYVDMVNTEFGSPLRSYWCACSVGHWFKKAGAVVPPDSVGSCERWHHFAVHNDCFTQEPQPGYAVLYGNKQTGLADHIGIVEQVVDGRVLSVEGNTTLTPGFDRNGWIVQQKDVNYGRVLGYIKPLAVTP